MSKLDKMIRFVPSIYKPGANPYVRGLLYSYSSEDDTIVQEIVNAKEQIFVKRATRQYLSTLGSNVGVFRPSSTGLDDELYRQLIPIMSFKPKQIKKTIREVLDVFFGANNALVFLSEINPNEIVIQIPNTVPNIRRSLIGSLHIHSYYATISAVDNIGKTIDLTLSNATKVLRVDELENAFLGQENESVPILSNTAGTTSTLQFAASVDLSVISTGECQMNLTNYPGSFLPDSTKTHTVTKRRGILNQAISEGDVLPVIVMSDSSEIPNEEGFVVFNMGRSNEELVPFTARPDNTSLLIDPTYSFVSDHSIGEVVNFAVKPYETPAVNGSDYAVYLVGVTAGRELAQEFVEALAASGIIIRWIIPEQVC